MQSSLLLQKPKVRLGLRSLFSPVNPFLNWLLFLWVMLLAPVSGALQAQVYPEGLTPKGEILNFQLSVVDEETGASLTSILVDVFRVHERGDRELVFTRSFYPGAFNLQLDRNFPYVILLQKKGYENLELELTSELLASKREWSKIVPLQKIGKRQSNSPSRTLDVRKSTKEIVPEKVIKSQAKDPERKLSSKKVYYRASMDVELLAEPKAGSEVLLSLKKGDMLVLEAMLNSSWWKVSFRDYTGWVPADTVRPVQ